MPRSSSHLDCFFLQIFRDQTFFYNDVYLFINQECNYERGVKCYEEFV